MKKIARIILTCSLLMLLSAGSNAQKLDEARMDRDIKVAEGVLSTLIKQQFDRQRMFFPLEVRGSYEAGYGVIFHLPVDYTFPVAMNFSGDAGDLMLLDGDLPGSFSYSLKSPPAPGRMDEKDIKSLEEEAQALSEQARAFSEQNRASQEQVRALREQARALEEHSRELRGRARAGMRSANADSLRKVYNEKLLAAAKDFLVDYGDLISQLGAQERVVITNRGDQPRVWMNQFYSAPKRTYISVEMTKADMTAHKQGKLTREQALSKVKVINTESVDAAEPDLELFSSIFNRLYRPDLATTFFTSESIYYERLKDFGAVYYMKVYSSTESRKSGRYEMPTVKLSDLDQAARDKKVKELYPLFEKELRENLLEYGRTVKSLGDNESLVVNVRMTKCAGCSIPASLEASVKGSVLKDYSAGKLSKDAALAKVTVKKGATQ